MFKLKVFVAVLLCTLMISTSLGRQICGNGVSQYIFSDQMGAGVQDWSWANTRQFNNCEPVHSGSHSFSFIPKTYDGVYFNLERAIDPLRDSYISLWVHGGGVGGQKVAIRLTQSKVAVNMDFPMFGPHSILVNCSDIQPNSWSQAIIDLSSLDPVLYDGIQILTMGNDQQARVYFDDVEVYYRCASDPHKRTLPTCPCLAGDCISAKIVEADNRWFQSGMEYQQYTITLKNMNARAITRIDFEMDGYSPRSELDIWGVNAVATGRWGLPSYVTMISAGGEFSFGCVSVRGAVAPRVVYVEYAH